MTRQPPPGRSSRAAAVDASLLAVPRRVQVAALLLTAVVIVVTSIPYVPRAWADFSDLPLLGGIQQPAGYGSDTIADVYESRVVANDPADMYTKRQLDQTPLEAQTWSKEASSPYPPTALLALTGLHLAGEWLGIGLYGMILLLAALFLAASAPYFLATRWYLFPLLYLNFPYFAYRLVSVQDGSYVVMLVVVIAALWLARRSQTATATSPRGPAAAHLLMAVATTMKLAPLYYARQVTRMAPAVAAAFVAVLAAGLVLPWFIWENYLYIYGFTSQRTGQDWPDTLGALAVVVPFTLVLWYVEAKRAFDLEERIGWSLVPFALLIGILTNTARHLLLVLLVPDKRAGRNVAAAIGVGLHTLLPSLLPLGAIVYVVVVSLSVVLWQQLAQIGWDVVRDDWRNPLRTAKMMLELKPAAPMSRGVP